MLNNMACSLIVKKRIFTTTAKAKELRKFIEPLLTRSKPQNDTMHSRRTVFAYLQDKEAVKELFDVIGEKIAERPGGYTRIIKIGTRLGDNADMCMIELVDFNEIYGVKEEAKTKTRRSRRGAGKGAAVVAGAVAADSIEDAVIVEEVVADEAPMEVAEETTEEVVAVEATAEEVVAEETTEEVVAVEAASEEVVAEETTEEVVAVEAAAEEVTTEEPTSEEGTTETPSEDEEKKAE
jgi:large subunit ribosomal protein L17